jgi:hypothetical protein
LAEAHNHHFVPQGYLRGFGDGVGRKARVEVIDLEKLTQFRTLVRNVAAQRDFNRLEIEGIDPNALEEGYAHLESSAAAAIKRVGETLTFEGDDKMIILNLVALLVIRNPRMRDNWSDFMGRIYKLTGEVMVSKKEIWESTKRQMQAAGHPVRENVTYEQMRDFIKGGEYDIVTNRLVHIRLELETLEKVIYILFERKWRLSVLPDNVPDLVTCDHPVCLISTIKRPEGIMGAIGYGLKDTAVVFPVTRRLALWGTFEGQEEVKECGVLQAALYNSHVLRNAERQIYFYDQNFEFIWGPHKRHGSQLLQSLKDESAQLDREGAKDDGTA